MGDSTRRIRKVIFIIAISVLIMQSTCYGMNMSSIEIQGMTESQAEESLRAVNFRKGNLEDLKKSEPRELLVTPFWIAIGTNDCMVGVYNLDGELLYSLRFTTNGQYSLYYNQEEDSLVIKMWRSGTYYYFDVGGEILKIVSRDCPQEGLFDSFKVDGEGNQYTIEKNSKLKDFYLYRYSQVVQHGNEEKIILECRYHLDIMSLFVFIMILVGGFGTLILQKMKMNEWWVIGS